MAAVIFVVDDDDGSREAMARALARVGHEVHQFPAAEEALARVRAGDPVDAVVSDVKMPGMDGFALLREVRSLRPDLAFLLVTAYGEVQAAVVALTEDGADDYLKAQEARGRARPRDRGDARGGEKKMVSVTVRRQQVEYVRGRGVSVRRACRLLSVARSTWRYESVLAGAMRR